MKSFKARPPATSGCRDEESGSFFEVVQRSCSLSRRDFSYDAGLVSVNPGASSGNISL